MTPERAHAYQRVMPTLNEMGPSKLLGDERERIREAADDLIFSRDLAQDALARQAMGTSSGFVAPSSTAHVGSRPRQMRSPTTPHKAGPPLLPDLRAA